VTRRFLIAAAIAFAPTLTRAADPTSVPAPTMKAGDGWIIDLTVEQGTSGFSERRLDMTTERVDDSGMVVGIKPYRAPVGYQDRIEGLDWSETALLDGVQATTHRPLSFPLTVGKTWTVDFVDPRRHGLQISIHNRTTFKVVGWEQVVVPAGSFRALKVEGRAKLDALMAPSAAVVNGGVVSSSDSSLVTRTASSPGGPVHATQFEEYFYVPEVKWFVKAVQEQYNSDNVRTHRETRTLVSFTPAS